MAVYNIRGATIRHALLCGAKNNTNIHGEKMTNMMYGCYRHLWCRFYKSIASKTNIVQTLFSGLGLLNWNHLAKIWNRSFPKDLNLFKSLCTLYNQYMMLIDWLMSDEITSEFSVSVLCAKFQLCFIHSSLLCTKYIFTGSPFLNFVEFLMLIAHLMGRRTFCRFNLTTSYTHGNPNGWIEYAK